MGLIKAMANRLVQETATRILCGPPAIRTGVRSPGGAQRLVRVAVRSSYARLAKCAGNVGRGKLPGCKQRNHLV